MVLCYIMTDLPGKFLCLSGCFQRGSIIYILRASLFLTRPLFYCKLGCFRSIWYAQELWGALVKPTLLCLFQKCIWLVLMYDDLSQSFRRELLLFHIYRRVLVRDLKVFECATSWCQEVLTIVWSFSWLIRSPSALLTYPPVSLGRIAKHRCPAWAYLLRAKDCRPRPRCRLLYAIYASQAEPVMSFPSPHTRVYVEGLATPRIFRSSRPRYLVRPFRLKCPCYSHEYFFCIQALQKLLRIICSFWRFMGAWDSTC